MQRADRGIAGAPRSSCRGRTAALARTSPGAWKTSAARTGDGAHRCRFAVPRIVAARRQRHVRGVHSCGRHYHRHRPHCRTRMRDRLQRFHDQGRHLLSDDRQEAPPRAGGRAREPRCLASIWSIPAAPICRNGRMSFPTASISAASFTIRQPCRRQVSRRLPWSWGRAPQAAPMCRRCRTRPSSCATRAPSFSAARRW